MTGPLIEVDRKRFAKNRKIATDWPPVARNCFAFPYSSARTGRKHRHQIGKTVARSLAAHSLVVRCSSMRIGPGSFVRCLRRNLARLLLGAVNNQRWQQGAGLSGQAVLPN